jgi:hypothetical protein
MKAELVVIIILNYNNKEDTLKCIQSVYDMDYSPFEVVVVDNGSEDGSAVAIKDKFPKVHLLESKTNLGVAGGRNFGLNFIKNTFAYKWVFILDNDTVVKNNTLNEMVKSFNSDYGIGIVTPKCYMMSQPGIINYAGGMSVNLFTGRLNSIGMGQEDLGQYDQPALMKSSGGLCLISDDVINGIGIFDEKFNPYGWEDVDFSLRARSQGYKIFYNPKAIVYHKGGKLGRGAKKEYEYAKLKNYFYLIRKHANFLQLISFALIFPIKALYLIVKEIYEGECKVLLFQLKSFFELIKRP